YLTATCLLLTSVGARAEEIALQPIVVSQPVRIEVFPTALKLNGPRSRAQLIVTGHYADGSMQDLTRASHFASTVADVAIVENTVVWPRKDGKSQIAVIAGGRAAVVPVEVTAYGQPQPVSFEYDALAALSKQGCNSGACHGSPSGKGGFRLSLRAFDPVLDKLT